MTEFFVSPRTGELISIEPLKIGWNHGHNITKNMILKQSSKPKEKGIRGKDRKPRRMHPNSLKNLKRRGKDKKSRKMHPNSLRNLLQNRGRKES